MDNQDKNQDKNYEENQFMQYEPENTPIETDPQIPVEEFQSQAEPLMQPVEVAFSPDSDPAYLPPTAEETIVFARPQDTPAAEIDPIYQDVTPPSATYGNETYDYQANAGTFGASQPYAGNYGSYGNPPQGNPSVQGSPYFTAKPVPDKPNASYQEVKDKRKRRGKAFRTFVACLALILGFYGTYTLGNYQAEQRMDQKLTEIRMELNNSKVGETASINKSPAASGEENSVVAIPSVVNSGSVSPVVAIADQVAPSVVTITATVRVKSSNLFFESQGQTYKGSGSGILYKQEGNDLYVVTNHHVIENGSDIKVTFYDSESVSAEVVGYDSRNDLAVLKVNASDISNTNIHLATFGDSTKLKVGQLAVAIGNPLGEGHDHTITAGVISSVNRTLDIENIKDLEVIQTDAAINPGNSGGALVNEFSEVIGINTAKYLDVKVEGMGFAIPSSIAIPVIEKIMKNGTGDAAYAISNDRPFLGIGYTGITGEIYSQTGISFGVYVTKVYEGSAAYHAGVKEGDILFSLNGTRIKDSDMLFDSIGKLAVGDTVKIGLVRNDKVFEVESVITSFAEVNAANDNQLGQKTPAPKSE